MTTRGITYDPLFDRPEPPLGEKGALRKRSVENLQRRLAEIDNDPDFQLEQMPPHYRDEFTCARVARAVTIIALVIIGIVAFSLFASQHLLTLPQDFMHAFQHATPTQLALGIGIPSVLILGALGIIYDARTKKETLQQLDVTFKQDDNTKGPKRTIIQKAPEIEIGTSRGVISNIEEHLVTVRLKSKDGGYVQLPYDYIDKSTLDEHGNGKAYLYWIKDLANHYTVSTTVAFFYTPLYLIGVIVYNLLRAVIVPFYVLVQCCREAWTGEALYPEQRKFELLDAPKEFIKSIKNVIIAPFYALAYFFAGVYSLINPMGGRNLAAAIERDWDGGVSLAEGFWSVRVFLGETGKYWLFEGGGGPDRLGRNGFYLAGCWQPTGGVEFANGKMIKAYSLAKAVDPKHGTEFECVTRTDLEKRATYNKEHTQSLINEYQSITDEIKRRNNIITEIERRDRKGK